MAGRLTVLSLLFLVPCLCLAQPAGQTDSLATDSLATVGAFLKPVLIDHLPNPLYEKSTNWGNQSMSAHHVEWRGIRPRVVKVPRNDGTWRKVRVTARNAASTLDLKLSDLKPDGAERQTFKGQLSLLVGVEVEQQIWEGGVRLYSGSLKARLKLKLAMDCETTLHLEEGKSLLPDATFRARV